MSALGHKRTFAPQNVAMSALPPKHIGLHHSNVCFVPKADISQRTRHVR